MHLRACAQWTSDWPIAVISRCTSACMAGHRTVCQGCAHRSLGLLSGTVSVPPAAICSLFHSFSSIRAAVAPSLSLDQRHGTCSKTICVSRTCKLTVFVVLWRRVFSISTRHIQRIRGAFCDDVLYKLTFTLHHTSPRILPGNLGAFCSRRLPFVLTEGRWLLCGRIHLISADVRHRSSIAYTETVRY